MRILPRSRRGTWLLAVAVWVTASALLWWALPGMPRSILSLPENSILLGFGADGETALVQHVVLPSGADPGGRFLELFEVPSGRSSGLRFDLTQFTVVGGSIDQTTWLLTRNQNSSPWLLRLDLHKRTVNELIEVPLDASMSIARALSPDGRFCVFADHERPERVVLWDLAANRQLDLPPNLCWPVAFSDDGRSMASNVATQPKFIGVFDLANGDCRARLSIPSYREVEKLCVNRDGTIVSAEINLGCTETWSWQVSTGEPETRLLDFATRHFVVVGPTETPYARLVRCTPTSRRMPTPWFPDYSQSPDGATLLIPGNQLTESASERKVRDLNEALLSRLFGKRTTAQFFDAATRGHLCDLLIGDDGPSRATGGTVARFVWMPDGKAIAVNRDFRSGKWQLWDIPPRKPLPWFAAGAALLAVAIAWLARRRVFMLRSLAPQQVANSIITRRAAFQPDERTYDCRME